MRLVSPLLPLFPMAALSSITTLACALFILVYSLGTIADPGLPLVLTPEQTKALEDRLPRTQQDMVLYHWTNRETWDRWVRQGEIGGAEFQTMIEQSAGMASGGGLYLASDTESSRNFGDYAAKIRIPKGTRLFDPVLVKEILNLKEPLSLRHKEQLGQKVEFIQKMPGIGNDWWVTHSASLARKSNTLIPISDARSDGLEFGGRLSTNFEKTIEFFRQRAGDPASHYPRRLLAILYAGNLKQFFHALYASPGDLQKVMGDAEFARVEKSISKWLLGYKTFEPLMNARTVPREQWIQNQRVILQSIFADFTGQSPSVAIRSAPMVGPELIVDPYQAEVLKRNPDLRVQILEENQMRVRLRIQYLAPEIGRAHV